MGHEYCLLDQYVWLFTFNIIALFSQFAYEYTNMEYTYIFVLNLAISHVYVVIFPESVFFNKKSLS